MEIPATLTVGKTGEEGQETPSTQTQAQDQVSTESSGYAPIGELGDVDWNVTSDQTLEDIAKRRREIRDEGFAARQEERSWGQSVVEGITAVPKGVYNAPFHAAHLIADVFGLADSEDLQKAVDYYTVPVGESGFAQLGEAAGGLAFGGLGFKGLGLARYGERAGAAVKGALRTAGFSTPDKAVAAANALGKIGQRVSKAPPVVRESIKGFVYDLLFTDLEGSILALAVDENSKSDILEWFADDENDPLLKRRALNAIDGIVLNPVFYYLGKAAHSLVKGSQKKKLEAIKQIVDNPENPEAVVDAMKAVRESDVYQQVVLGVARALEQTGTKLTATDVEKAVDGIAGLVLKTNGDPNKALEKLRISFANAESLSADDYQKLLDSTQSYVKESSSGRDIDVVLTEEATQAFARALQGLPPVDPRTARVMVSSPPSMPGAQAAPTPQAPQAAQAAQAAQAPGVNPAKAYRGFRDPQIPETVEIPGVDPRVSKLREQLQGAEFFTSLKIVKKPDPQEQALLQRAIDSGLAKDPQAKAPELTEAKGTPQPKADLTKLSDDELKARGKAAGIFTSVRSSNQPTPPRQPHVNLPSSKGGYKKLPAVYIRFGDLPRNEQGQVVASKNHLTGKNEKGVSVVAAWFDPKTNKYVIDSGGEQLTMGLDDLAERKAFVVKGKELVDVGGDEEPLLDAASVVIDKEVDAADLVTASTPYYNLKGDEVPDGFVPNWNDEPDMFANVKLANDPQRQTAVIQGLTKATPEGEAIIVLFEGADSFTLLEELTHVALLQKIIPDEAIKSLEDVVGKPIAGWNRFDHEQITQSLMKYSLGGTVDDALVPALSGLRSYIGEARTQVESQGVKISKEVSKALDAIAGKRGSIDADAIVANNAYRQWIEELVNVTGIQGLRNIPVEELPTFLNIPRLSSDEDIQKLLSNTVVQLESSLEKTMGKTQKLKTVTMLGEKMLRDLGVDTTIRRTEAIARQVEQSAYQQAAIRSLHYRTAEEVVDVASRLKGQINPSADDVARLQDMVEGLVRVSIANKRLSAAQSRALGSRRAKVFEADLKRNDIRFEAEVQDMRKGLADLVAAGDDVGLRDDALNTIIQVAKKGNPQQLRKIRYASKGRRILLGVLEAIKASMLSGFKTLSVNFASGGAMTWVMPLERLLGSAVSLDAQNARHALYLLKGTYLAWADMFQSFRNLADWSDASTPAGRLGKVWTEESPILSASTQLADSGEQMKAFSAENFGLDKDSLAGRIVDGYRFFAISPVFRTMLASDEMWKNISARAMLHADVMEEAAMKGLKGNDIDELFAIRTNEAFGADGRIITDNQKGIRYKEYADQVTFTEPLEDTFGSWINRGTVAMPLLQFIMPFVKTPLNILKRSFDYTPLAFAMSGLNINPRKLAVLEKGDTQALMALRGRAAVGTGLTFAVATLAMNGMITGSGPRDPEARRRWEAAGNRPYSIMYTDEQGNRTAISFLRFEPIALPAAIVADTVAIYEQSRLNGVDITTDVQGILGAVGVGLVNATMDKTFLRGVADFFSALGRGDQTLLSVGENLASSALPYRSLRSEATTATDDYQRQVYTFVQRLMSQVPGLSDKLDPVRDALGEPIDTSRTFLAVKPINTEADIVNEELSRLSTNGETVKSRQPIVNGIDLRKFTLTGPKGNGIRTAFDRLAELDGTVKIGGRTLRQAVERLIKSPAYKKVPDTQSNVKADMIRSVIRQYRQVANEQIMKEMPELKTIKEFAATLPSQVSPEGAVLAWDEFVSNRRK